MAAKKESTFLSMVVTLFIVSAVAAMALGYVYQLTKAPIAKAKLEKKKKAIRQVVPTFDNNPVNDTIKVGLKEGDTLECYLAYSGKELTGIAVKANTKKGFSGEFWVIAGFLPDGTIYNSAILEHKETPGLGDKMQKEKSVKTIENEDGSVDTTWWTKQFMGMKPLFEDKNFKEAENIKVSKDGGEIDAITAATISSRGYCDAVNRAYHAFTLAMEKLNAEE